MGKINNLSTAEKLELIDELWENVLKDQSKITITEAQREELDRRLDQYEIDKDEGESWKIVRGRISNKQYSESK